MHPPIQYTRARGCMKEKYVWLARLGPGCLRVKSKLEVSTHVTVLITSLAYAALVEFFYGHSTHICVDRECITYKRGFFYSSHIVSYVITSFVVFILVFCVIYLVHLYIRFRGIITRVKWEVLKLSILLVFLVTDLVLELSLYLIYTGYKDKDFVVATFTLNSTILKMVFILSLMAMLHLPRSKCCKRSNKVTHRTPLLSNSNIQCTNPPSVWDHHNDPSTTVFCPPPEMSDCVSE